MKREEVREATPIVSYPLDDMETVKLVVSGGKRLRGGHPTLQFMVGLEVDGEILMWIEGWRIRDGKLMPPSREAGVFSYPVVWLMNPTFHWIIANAAKEAFSGMPEFSGVTFVKNKEDWE